MKNTVLSVMLLGLTLTASAAYPKIDCSTLEQGKEAITQQFAPYSTSSSESQTEKDMQRLTELRNRHLKNPTNSFWGDKLNQNLREYKVYNVMYYADNPYCISSYLANKENPVDLQNVAGENIAYFAAKKGNLETIKMLDKAGAKLYAMSDISKLNTADQALINGHKDIVEYLKARGVEPSQRGKAVYSKMQQVNKKGSLWKSIASHDPYANVNYVDGYKQLAILLGSLCVEGAKNACKSFKNMPDPYANVDYVEGYRELFQVVSVASCHISSLPILKKMNKDNAKSCEENARDILNSQEDKPYQWTDLPPWITDFCQLQGEGNVSTPRSNYVEVEENIQGKIQDALNNPDSIINKRIAGDRQVLAK